MRSIAEAGPSFCLMLLYLNSHTVKGKVKQQPRYKVAITAGITGVCSKIGTVATYKRKLVKQRFLSWQITQRTRFGSFSGRCSASSSCKPSKFDEEGREE
ncbi:hypothetical protein evm_013192 [Chilo suppressalis]|nr:hypothetical protein evm_013192 [Chilo suppressalis]